MKKLLIVLTVALAACTGPVKKEQKDNTNVKEQETTITAVPLNNGSKWKADEVTKKNVAELLQVVNNSSYADEKKRSQLYATMQTKIDTLVKQCKMQGPEHEALHVWLKKILEDMKKLKEDDNEYGPAYANLRKDVESFNTYFE
jgi:hypothetical protein